MITLCRSIPAWPSFARLIGSVFSADELSKLSASEVLAWAYPGSATRTQVPPRVDLRRACPRYNDPICVSRPLGWLKNQTSS